jgi:hypothetical protein
VTEVAETGRIALAPHCKKRLSGNFSWILLVIYTSLENFLDLRAQKN